MLTVLKPGESVKWLGSLAWVVQVCIQFNARVIYEIVWYHGPERKSAWVDAFEIGESEPNQTMKIGFAAIKGAS